MCSEFIAAACARRCPSACRSRCCIRVRTSRPSGRTADRGPPRAARDRRPAARRVREPARRAQGPGRADPGDGAGPAPRARAHPADRRRRARTEATLERWPRDAPPGSVVFAGQVSEADLPRYYAPATCSRCRAARGCGGLEVEGWGNVFIEAAACGRPVVVGDSGGARESLVDGETGMLVDGARRRTGGRRRRRRCSPTRPAPRRWATPAASGSSATTRGRAIAAHARGLAARGGGVAPEGRSFVRRAVRRGYPRVMRPDRSRRPPLPQLRRARESPTRTGAASASARSRTRRPSAEPAADPGRPCRGRAAGRAERATAERPARAPSGRAPSASTRTRSSSTPVPSAARRSRR